jgi:hypothetical protein
MTVTVVDAGRAAFAASRDRSHAVKLRTRLKQLERRLPPPADDTNRDLTEEEWLEHFEQLARDGALDGEPEFPVALADYREAMRPRRY